MLGSSDILRILKSCKDELAARYTVQSIGLFGSYLHGNPSEASDIDLLVTMKQPTFDHYMDLKFYLEQRMQKTVDLVLAEALKARLKPTITRDVVYA